MALRDLVVSQDELTEEQIEELVTPFLRYDPEARQLVLLPPAMDLGNRQRVIAYLIGLLGWAFVLSDDPPATAMSPTDLASALQIPGGTLRPILKALKDERLIQVEGHKYSVNHVTFPLLKEQIAGGRPSAPTKKRRSSRSKKKTEPQLDLSDPAPSTAGSRTAAEPVGATMETAAKPRAKRDATAAGAGPLARVRELIAEGWFATPRTVQDIVKQMASRGATYRGQDLTRQMITLVRSRDLTRERARKGGSGREMWHYRVP